ncbi:hypothetical protein DA469_12945 [Bacillus subtilis]|nr:hypothetical protein DA469_12945 [Bacillus subtilis]
MRGLEQQFVRILSNVTNRTIVEKMMLEEGFVLTSKWLNTEDEGIRNINEFLNHIREKTGITRYFKRASYLLMDLILKKGFTDILIYFDPFGINYTEKILQWYLIRPRIEIT